MKIAVIGAGGVGGYFGARLARSGHDVQFLARGEHLRAMRERGLEIRSDVESFTLPSPSATDDPAQLAVADVMLVATKLWDLEPTARQVAGAVGAHTVVVPFQNGVDAVDLLGRGIPRERIAAGVAYISAVIGAPGVIAMTGTMARLRVGALQPAQSDTLKAFVRAGEAAGFATEFVEDPTRMLWEKFIGLNALSAMTAVTRQPIGVIRADPDMRATLQAVIGEGVELANRGGVSLPAEFAQGVLSFMDTLPESMRASMAHDLLAGRRLEAPWLCGAVARRASAVGLPVPVNATIWAALKPFVDGAPKSA
jgi:2-dehydropantoate 2-reductase